MDKKPHVQEADPSTWPAHVRQSFPREMAALGLDEDRNLYWHGKPIQIQKRMKLTVWERLFANFRVLW